MYILFPFWTQTREFFFAFKYTMQCIYKHEARYALCTYVVHNMCAVNTDIYVRR